MNVSAYFSNSGTPATGLGPIINIRDISDGSLVVTGAAMTEVGDGFYKYAFAGYNSAKDYSIRCDGGVALLAADRYAIATSGDGEDFSATEKASLNAATPTVDLSSVSTFDPTTDTVARVTLVDTTTTNTDMRGTDNAATAVNLAVVDAVVDAIKLRVDAFTSAGEGDITWTYTLTDDISGLPIANADVWVSSDDAGLLVLASGKTNSDGIVTFFLDAGPVCVWRQHPDYSFSNPDVEVVS